MTLLQDQGVRLCRNIHISTKPDLHINQSNNNLIRCKEMYFFNTFLLSDVCQLTAAYLICWSDLATVVFSLVFFLSTPSHPSLVLRVNNSSPYPPPSTLYQNNTSQSGQANQLL